MTTIYTTAINHLSKYSIVLQFLPKPFIYAFSAIFLFIAFAIGGLLVWVKLEPRLVQGLTPHIEQAFSASDGSYKATIKETWLTWGNWRHPIDVRLRDIDIITKENKKLSSFSEIAIRIDVLQLPLGRVLPTSITLNDPVISLFQNEDKSINFGFGKLDVSELEKTGTTQKPESSVPLADSLKFLFSPDSDSGLRKLRRLSIHNANINIGNFRKRVFFELAGTEILIKRDWYGNFKIIAGGDMLYKQYQSPVGIEIVAPVNQDRLKSTIMFENMVPSVLASLFMDNENPAFKTLDAPLGGQIVTHAKFDGTVEKLLFNLSVGTGHINTEALEKPLAIDSIQISGSAKEDLKDIRIDSLSVLTGQTTISGHGNAQWEEGDAAIQAQLTLHNAQTEDIKKFWPVKASPVSREWVISNMTHGKIPEASAKIDIKMGDLQRPTLPKEAVEGRITLADTTIRYLPEHPVVKNVQSIIRIDGVSLHADILRADFIDSTLLSNGSLAIDDLNADNPYIKLAFDGKTNGKDAVQILRLPRLQHAKSLNLDPETTKGDITARAILGFHFYAPTTANGKASEEADITYDITADLKDLAAPAFLKRFDVKNSHGKLAINNQQLAFNGNGHVNGASASQLNVIYKFEPENGIYTFIDVVGSAPMEALPRFGYPSFPPSTGTIAVSAKVELGKNLETATASLDLADADLNITAIGWKKPAKEPATAELKTEKKNGIVKITDFIIAGKNTEAIGSARLSKDLSGIEQLQMRKTKIGAFDLETLEYDLADAPSVLVKAKGKSADLSSWLDNDAEPSQFSFKNFPAVRLNAEIDLLRLSKQGIINQFKGNLYCDARICHDASFTGFVGNKKSFDFRILRNPKGNRQISLHAIDAGAFLKALGAYPNLEGGDLTITGNYDEGEKGSTLKGRILITDFTVKKAPVLAKILSLASITGVADLLQGKGIAFSKLQAPFTLHNDVMAFDKGRAYGASIGLTNEGTITFPKQTLDMQGTVVPAYVINNFLGKVPLVGELFTGGDGKGVFAFSYTVKGTERDPDVSVNPLSILTPGFLRGIFEKSDIVPEKAKSDR